MRWTWVIALLILAAAFAAALWPHGDRPSAGGAPAEQPALVCPLPPDLPVSTRAEPIGTPGEPVPATPPANAAAPAAPKPAASGSASSAALDSLLGGSLTGPAGAPAAGTAEVTVGQKASIERIDDRTVRIDGKYTVRGSGSEEDPFQVSWEMLGSAAATVDAEQHRFEIPGRVADLRGAWIRISGYWAPPLQVFEAKEAMLMLNKWDGCCVGLPPTPFDSIEASFAAPMQVKGAHVFRYGTFRGRLSVEPYVAGTFLLGIYRLQDVVMESSS